MSKDSFNIKKINKDDMIVEKKEDIHSGNKDGLCYDLDNKSGICSYVIMEGIDIGWIWKDINITSKFIMRIINKTPRSKNDIEEDTNDIDKLKELESIQEDIQNYVLKSAFVFLFLIVTYVTLTTKMDPGKNTDVIRYFGITNICYFIKDLVTHGSFNIQADSKYNFGYITIMFIIAFCIFLPEIVKRKLNPPKDDDPSVNGFFGLTGNNQIPFGMILIIMFISILSLGWFILGNVLFTKRSVLLITITFSSAIIIGIILKSSKHYLDIKKKKGTLEENEINRNVWVSIILIASIIIINLCIITYLAIKNIKFIENTNESVQHIDANYKDLTDYFKEKIFTNLHEEQSLLNDKIKFLQKDFKNLMEDDTLKDNFQLKETYKRYFQKMLHAMKSKDEWFKNTCKLYRLDPNKVNTFLDVAHIFTNMAEVAEGDPIPVEKEIFVKLFEDDLDVMNVFIEQFGSYIPDEDSKFLAENWITPAVIRDLLLGAILRIGEIFNIVIVNPIDIVINIGKSILHFIVHSFDKDHKIEELRQMNLLNYWYTSILKAGTKCNIDYAHKRIAAMYELFIQLNMPSSN